MSILAVDDAAAAWAALHREVHAGHVIIVGNSELGALGRATDKHTFTLAARDLLRRGWTGSYFEDDCHCLAVSSATGLYSINRLLTKANKHEKSEAEYHTAYVQARQRKRFGRCQWGFQGELPLQIHYDIPA